MSGRLAYACFADRLRYAYEAIFEKDATTTATASMPARHVESGEADIQKGGFIQAVENVSACTTAGELIESVRKLAASLGCDRFVYQWICFDARPMLTAAGHAPPDHWLVAGARRHGFGRGLIMPSHRFGGGGTKLAGLLHPCITDAQLRMGGECELWKNRRRILVLCFERYRRSGFAAGCKWSCKWRRDAIGRCGPF